MTNSNEPGPYAVCVCGHERIDHENGYKCQEVSLIRNGAKALCGCDLFRPALLPSPADHESLPAHDVPAAQLRERIATLERELTEAKALLAGLRLEKRDMFYDLAWTENDKFCLIKAFDEERTEHRNHVTKLTYEARERIDLEHDNAVLYKSERDTARAEIESLKQKVADYHAWGLKGHLELDQARAEAADLRAQLAERHTLADMAAGLLAEKGRENG